MKNVTYLMGAGASAQCLPVVKNIPESIEKVIILLNQHILNFTVLDHYNTKNVGYIDLLENLIDDLIWLKEASITQSTIDTYAKKLKLKFEFEKLTRLKQTLSIFFTIWQIIKPVDKRYDTFFASILNDNFSKFPTNLNIVTWNYDFQFEITYADYLDKEYIDQTSLRIETKNLNRSISNEGFNIFKLNGSANIQEHGFREYFYSNIISKNNSLEKSEVIKILQNYYNLKNNKEGFYHSLSFAWEEELNPNGKSFFQTVKQNVAKTNVLVIIGYSFPFFNREIDRQVINSMVNLEKVYFQDLFPQNIIDRFKSIREDLPENKLIAYKDIEQFFLPNEL
jgi:hypothetical protein